jgi:HEAT repeat protein
MNILDRPSTSRRKQQVAALSTTTTTAAKNAKPLAAFRFWLLLFLAAGCGKAPPSAGDLSSAPWLDPKVQIGGLASDESIIRGASAHNLGNIGAAAADAMPQLELLAKNDPEVKVREKAAAALDKIRAAVGQDGSE